MDGRLNFRWTALLSTALTWLLGGALAGCGGRELAEATGEPHGVVTSALTYPNGSNRTVTSRRVVYKDASGNYAAAAGLEAFRAAGAPDSDLYSIRIAEVDAPAVRNALVVMSAGQKVFEQRPLQRADGTGGGLVFVLRRRHLPQRHAGWALAGDEAAQPGVVASGHDVDGRGERQQLRPPLQ